MMLFSLPLFVATSCDNFERTEVEYTITVNHNSVTLFEGETKQLSASPSDGGAYAWKSLDETIATVDGSGLVTAVGHGVTSVICSRDDMSFEVEIIVNEKVELEDVKLRCDAILELAVVATQTVAVEVFPAEANDVPLDDFDWWSDDEAVARVSDAGVIKGIGIGETTIHYRRGDIFKEITVVVDTSFPLIKGQPFVVKADGPSELWFRDFDRGGKNIAFYDTGGGSGNTYRADMGDFTSSMVTIEGGGNLGYLDNGEWYIYTIDVEQAGTYEVTVNLGGGSGDGWYHFEVDGVRACDNFMVPNTGGWGNFADYKVTIELPEGSHKLKFYADAAQHNPRHMTFNLVK